MSKRSKTSKDVSGSRRKISFKRVVKSLDYTLTLQFNVWPHLAPFICKVPISGTILDHDIHGLFLPLNHTLSEK